MKKIAISLVTFNGGSCIDACIESVKRQTLQDFDLIVFDNASTDDTCQRIVTQFPSARIHRNPDNIGFAAAHNASIRESTSEYVCILNQDVRLEPDYLERCVSCLDDHPDAGAVSGLLLRTDSLERLPSNPVVDGCGHVVIGKYFVRLRGEGESPDRFAQSCEVFGVPATAALYRRASLRDSAERHQGRYEYFDESFFMYKEDVDLMYRLAWRGWRAWYCASARAWHIRSKRHGSRLNPLVNEWSYRNNLYVEYKNLSFGILARYGALIFLRECAKVVYLAFREPRCLRGLTDVVRNADVLSRKRRTILANRRASDAELLTWYTHHERQ